MAIKRYLGVLGQRPQAVARICGSGDYPGLHGTAEFYSTGCGVLVSVEVWGLPTDQGECSGRIFGMHIHSGGSCTGTAAEPFADALGHYNPDGCPHPEHRGDLPPLLGCDGHALLVVLTDRFALREVVGRSLILHGQRDDFTTQPSGNAGAMIACGVIAWCC